MLKFNIKNYINTKKHILLILPNFIFFLQSSYSGLLCLAAHCSKIVKKKNYLFNKERDEGEKERDSGEREKKLKNE